METLKKLKYVILFFLIIVIGGLISGFSDWMIGMFGSWITFISGILLLGGFTGMVISAIRLFKKNK